MQKGVLLRYLAATLATGVFLGVLAPLGSDVRFSPPSRYGFWVASCAAGWLQALVIARGVRSILSPGRFPGWLLLLVSAAALTIPMSFEVPRLWRLLAQTEGSSGPSLIAIFNIGVINLAFTAVQYLLVERWPLTLGAQVAPGARGSASSVANAADRENAATQAPPPHTSMLRRRPDGLSGVILAISAEDHYLRVHCERGDGLVLYRLAEAMEDLAATEGMRVHRSWWVARDAVQGGSMRGRDGELVLSNGIKVPVSRTYIRALREAGWG